MEILTKKYAPEVSSTLDAQYPSLRRHRASTPNILSPHGVKSTRHVSCPTSSYYYDTSSNSGHSYNARKVSLPACDQPTTSSHTTDNHPTIISHSTSGRQLLTVETPYVTKSAEESKAASLENIEIKVPSLNKPQNTNLARRNTVAATMPQQKVEKKTQAWKFIEKCVSPLKKSGKISSGSPIKKIANKLQKLKSSSTKSNIATEVENTPKQLQAANQSGKLKKKYNCFTKIIV